MIELYLAMTIFGIIGWWKQNDTCILSAWILGWIIIVVFIGNGFVELYKLGL